MSSDSPVVTTVNARALASRRNGARSRGPKTAAGKARSSRNALKHGLCATKFLVFPEDAAGFRALEAALLAELAPVGALQAVLAQRVVSAAWRLMRADRIEAEVLDLRRYQDSDLGLALIRDGNGTRSIDTVLRYRGAALAEFMRVLKTLQALQAEARATADQPVPACRRRGRRSLAARNEPTKARQTNGLTDNGAARPRPDASDRGRPAAGPGLLELPGAKNQTNSRNLAKTGTWPARGDGVGLGAAGFATSGTPVRRVAPSPSPERNKPENRHQNQGLAAAPALSGDQLDAAGR